MNGQERSETVSVEATESACGARESRPTRADTRFLRLEQSGRRSCERRGDSPGFEPIPGGKRLSGLRPSPGAANSPSRESGPSADLCRPRDAWRSNTTGARRATARSCGPGRRVIHASLDGLVGRPQMLRLRRMPAAPAASPKSPSAPGAGIAPASIATPAFVS